MSENYKFFQNSKCEFFPCHKNCDASNFNCLFCFCPLYTMGPDCGGNFSYTKSGVKDCSGCTLVHSKKGYEYIIEKLNQIGK